MMNRILVGYNDAKERVSLTVEDLFVHAHVIGASGTGKSMWAGGVVARQIINQTLLANPFDPDAFHSLIVIDPNRDLFTQLSEYCASRLREEDTIAISFNDTYNQSIGLNWLEPCYLNAHAHADLVGRGIAKAIGQQDEYFAMPNLDRWQRNTLVPIIRYNQITGENLPLPACYEFLHDPYFQQRILQKVDDYYLTTEWENLAENSRRQQEDVLLAVHNRIAKYAQDETLRRILGQTKTTIDFGQCMDNDKILLFDTSPINISKEASRLLSIVILDKIMMEGFKRLARPEQERKKVLVIVDEAHAVFTPDLALNLATSRKMGISFMLIHQHLYQLKKESEDLYWAVLGNCKTKICFGGLSRPDAEVIMGEFRTGELDMKSVKDERYHTLLIPSETTRKTRSYNWGESEEEGWNESETDGWSETDSETFEQSVGENWTNTEGENWTNTEGENWSETDSESWGESHSENWQESESTSESYQESRSRNRSRGSSVTRGENGDIESESESVGDVISHSYGRQEARTRSRGGSHATTYNRQKSTSRGWNRSKSIGGSRSKGYGLSKAFTKSGSISRGCSGSQGRSKGESVSIAPFYEYQRERELSNRTFWSLEELREEAIAEIKNLPDRCFLLKVRNQPTKKVVSPTVKKVGVIPEDIEQLQENSYRQYAKPVEEIDREIEERRQKILGTGYEPITLEVEQKIPSEASSGRSKKEIKIPGRK